MKTLTLLLLVVGALSALGKGYPVKDGRYLDCWVNGRIVGTLYLYNGISQQSIDEFKADCVDGLVQPRKIFVDQDIKATELTSRNE